MINFTHKLQFAFGILFMFGLTLTTAQNPTSKNDQKLFGQDITTANLNSIEHSGVIRCGSVEYEQYLQKKFKQRSSTEEFENWLESKKEATLQQRAASPNIVVTIPIVFHIITDGSGSDNLSQDAIQAQVDQLNIDYRNLAGSTYDVAADVELEFCLAIQDESGNEMAEPGINRITDYGDGTFTDSYVNTTIKPQTQWDPTKYMNVWVVPGLTNGFFELLGYAQFPDYSGLDGLDTTNDSANTDGIVIIASSVGSVANPNPNGAPYASGRTLTHEAGHWLGLRHIWGDGDCSDDDYCDDTPNANGSNSGCPTNQDSCPFPAGEPDMVENYMDYTYDTCMHTFTEDQKTRIITVLANSPRRVELLTSNVCQPAQVYNINGKIEIENLNLDSCNGSITPEVTITNNGLNQLTSLDITYDVNGSTSQTYNWTGSLNNEESEVVTLNFINTGIGTHTLNVSISNVNGTTDENTNNDTDTSTFEATGSVCSSVADTTYNTSTTGVIFNNISNLNTGKPSGYSDYTAISTDVNRESSYDLTVNANSDGNYQIITYVWIDWNQNCSFDDPGEQYDLGTSVGINNEATTNSPLAITVPEDAVLGSTIMRVATKYNQAPTSCENNYDGEVEDYTINVLAALSTDEYTLKSSISLYPNPTTSELNIGLKNTNDLPDSYEVYNMLGQSIMRKTIATDADLTINSSTLSNGMYFIKINKDNASVTLPFIKK